MGKVETTKIHLTVEFDTADLSYAKVHLVIESGVECTCRAPLGPCCRKQMSTIRREFCNYVSLYIREDIWCTVSLQII